MGAKGIWEISVASPWLFYELAAAAAAKSLQSCPTLCYPRDCSPPGSLIPGILQARTLEWVAISFSYTAAKEESQRLTVYLNWELRARV